VGVLTHEKAPDAVFEETDFVWMYGHNVRLEPRARPQKLTAVKKVSMEKSYEAYKRRNETLDFQIMFREIVVDRSDAVKPFLEPNNNIVIFMARPSGSQTVDLRQSARVKDEPKDDLHTSSTMPVPAPVTPATSSVFYRPEDAILDHVTARDGLQAQSSPCFARSSAPFTIPILASKEHGISPPGDSLRGVVRPSLHPETTPPVVSGALIARLPTSLAHGKEACTSATKRETLPAITANPSPYVRTPKVTPVKPVPLPTKTPKITPVPLPTKTPMTSGYTPEEIHPNAVKYERPATHVYHHMEEGSQTTFNPEEFFNRDASPDHQAYGQVHTRYYRSA
jgi:hypothetical protein